MNLHWDRAVDVAVVCLLALGVGLTAYVLWDDWKIHRERAIGEAYARGYGHKPAVVEDQVADVAPTEAGG
jgi:hypothetical protein